MVYRKICSGLVLLVLAFNAVAKGLPERSFPYGRLALRGYPMEMSKDGHFRIYSGSTTFVEGTFILAGNKITVTDSGGQYACKGRDMNPGSYYWTVHDEGLYLMLIKDHCTARRTAFLEAPLKIRPPVK